MADATTGAGRLITAEAMRTPVTVLALLHLFQKHCDARVVGGTLAPSSRRELDKRLRYARPLYDIRIEELGDVRLDRWMHSMDGSPGLQRNAASALRTAFLWARRESLVAGDPTWSIRALTKPAKRGEPLSREQMIAFLGACAAEKEEHRRRFEHLSPLHVARATSTSAALEIIALTGVRSGGLGGARVEDFNPQRRTLRIKTKGVWRTMKLAKPVVELLLQRRALVLGHHDHLFPGQRNGGVGSTTLNTAFKRIGKRAGIPPNHHEHDLRHSVATLARESGMTWVDVSELLMHVDPATTREIYDHSDVTPTGLALADHFVRFLGVHHV